MSREKESGSRNVKVTSTAKSFWLGGRKQDSPKEATTQVLVVRGTPKALEEARQLLELQDREHGLELAKW